MIIDCHVYCLPPRLRDLHAPIPPSDLQVKEAIFNHPESPLALSLSGPEEILKSMDENKIHESTLVAFPWSDQNLMDETNEYLLKQALSNPRFKVIGAVNPSQPQWREKADLLLKEGVIGLKINPAWQGYELDSKPVLQLADVLSQHNRFLMTHIDQPYEKSPSSPQHLFSLAKQKPQLKILAAHLGGLVGLSTLHEPVKKILGNVWFDTAISSTLSFVRFYCEAGLGDRIIFGSDFPFNHSHSQGQVVEGIKKLGLNGENLEKIFYKNFLQLSA